MSATDNDRARAQSLAFFMSDRFDYSRFIRLLLCLGGLILLAACGPGPTAPLPQTLPPTNTARAVLATLPPTWTLTPTFTPAPPTATTTLTLSPSLTPTLSTAETCDAFVFIGAPRSGIHLNENSTTGVTISWQYPLADVTALFRLDHDPGGQTREITLAGNALVAATLPLDSLFGPGLYRWAVIPHDASGQALPGCAINDSFVIIVDSFENPQGRFSPEPAWAE